MVIPRIFGSEWCRTAGTIQSSNCAQAAAWLEVALRHFSYESKGVNDDSSTFLRDRLHHMLMPSLIALVLRSARRPGVLVLRILVRTLLFTMKMSLGRSQAEELRTQGMAITSLSYSYSSSVLSLVLSQCTLDLDQKMMAFGQH